MMHRFYDTGEEGIFVLRDFICIRTLQKKIENVNEVSQTVTIEKSARTLIIFSKKQKKKKNKKFPVWRQLSA